MNRSNFGVSSEKNDMERPDSTVNIRRIAVIERPLRCVWTSHPDHEHCCRSPIPARVVTAAWSRELELGRTCAGFFHFAYHGRVWLAYGMPDGGVRGVYCPTHRAEREERLGYDPELVLRVAAGYAV
jgi:hypothetical protein